MLTDRPTDGGSLLARLGDLRVAACPSRSVLEHVTSRWGVLVLLALSERTHRFSDLRRVVEGVSEKMLAQTLRNLELDGFVQRRPFQEVPPRVEYELTAMGREVAQLVESLTRWIEKSIPSVMQARATWRRETPASPSK